MKKKIKKNEKKIKKNEKKVEKTEKSKTYKKYKKM